MKAYLLNFSNLIDHNYVLSVLNNSNSIENWLSPFPYSAIVVSRLTCLELGAVLHSHFADHLFILVEATTTNTAGWLPSNFWEFINNPQASWAKQVFPQIARPNLPTPPTR